MRKDLSINVLFTLGINILKKMRYLIPHLLQRKEHAKHMNFPKVLIYESVSYEA